MTLALALNGEGFFMLAADRRQTVVTKSGYYSEEVSKLVRLAGNCALVVSGPSWAEVMVKATAAKLRLSRITDMLLWNFGEELTVSFKIKCPDDHTQKVSAMSMLLVGPDEQGDMTGVHFESPNFLVMPIKTFKTIGSGAQSTYFLKRIYDACKPNPPSLEQLVLLACFCIGETAKQDAFVGDGMDIWVVSKNGIEELDSERISAARQEADKISEQIAKFFIGPAPNYT